jgi:intein-encoded DNA endonuclease-like protein
LAKVKDSEPYTEPLSWPPSEQLRFVRGFADGEGGPRLYFHKTRNLSTSYANIRMVVISNTDLPLLMTIKRILSNVGIESTIYLDHRAGEKKAKKDSYVLVILRGESLAAFQRLIGFTNPAKAAKLLEIVRSYKRYAKTVKSCATDHNDSRP